MEQDISLDETKLIMLPTFSRLPPDGDEFPPNFTEPFKQQLTKNNNHNNNIDLNENNSMNMGPPPPLPKSIPPKTAPRKIYRQDFVIEVGDIRNNKNETIIQLDSINNITTSSVIENLITSTITQPPTITSAASIPIIIEDKTIRKPTPPVVQVEQRKRSIDSCIDLPFNKYDTTINNNTIINTNKFKTLTSNWRKDEKSEKSVRDKIAMFSNGKKSLNQNDLDNGKKFIAKSTENLSSNYSLIDTKINNNYNNGYNSLQQPIQYQQQQKQYQLEQPPYNKQQSYDDNMNGNFVALKHKALSVENLNDIKKKSSVIITPKLRTNLIKINTDINQRENDLNNIFNNNNNNQNSNNSNNNINNIGKNKINSHKILSKENVNNFNNMNQNDNDFIRIEKITPRIIDNNMNQNKQQRQTTSLTPSIIPSTLKTKATTTDLLQKPFYGTLPRKTTTTQQQQQHPLVTRTTSFSGYTMTTPTPTPITQTQTDDQRKAKINNLLEQRKKSMSKLRGLVIPDKIIINEEKFEPILLDLPEIKNKEMQKIQSNNFSKDYNNISSYGKENINNSSWTLSSLHKNNNNRIESLITPTKTNGAYQSIFSTSRPSVQAAIIKNKNLSNSTFVEDKNKINGSEFMNGTKLLKDKKTLPPPPVKPPRTSLILTPKSSVGLKIDATDDSEDSDCIFGSQISSPPLSPVAVIPEKYPLTRTLSSETNTSIASSTTSTLTSGSGSQASCSSMGSTPTVDMSRKFQKSSNTETNNRRNILASSRCRSGRDENSSLLARQRKSDDDDSTDGCEEADFNKTPKPKKRNSLILTNKTAEVQEVNNRPIHYQLARKEDLVDKVINVATYIEVVSSDAEIINDSKKIDILIDTKKEEKQDESELSKWVRSEMKKVISTTNNNAPIITETLPLKDQKSVRKNSVHEKISKINSVQSNTSPPIPHTRTVDLIPTNNYIKSSANQKQISTAEIRKAFEIKTPPPAIPAKSKENGNHHERLSSWDSIASSSDLLSTSTVIKTKTITKDNHNTKKDFGSFLSVGDDDSLISAQDLQLLIEEAEPQLETPDVFVVVLKREFPESSIGITLAGGSDYEAKEITIHRILKNSPADKDGRLKRSDRILSINGLSMKGLTHGESVSVLKTPRPEVLMVMTRSKSVITKPLAKTKRGSLGSLSSLIDKESDTERKIKTHHASSKSLDLDAMTDGDDSMESRKGSSSSDSTYSKGLQKSEIVSTISSTLAIEKPIIPKEEKLVTINQVTTTEVKKGTKDVEVIKDGCGLGFSIEGGRDSPNGNMPLLVKKVFMGGAASKTGKIKAGDEIIAIDNKSTLALTRVEVWHLMKHIPPGTVLITFR